ncbi:MAG: glycosyltransferase family 39 protein [Crocinitomicaceae bacterium]|nr:glycosyltransferase family 39 protein [Crocinitomicaceae bacterium]
MIAKLKYHWQFLLILLGGIILRFLSSSKHSYSNDELSAITRLRYDNLSELLEFGVMKGDMHPAGVQVFMKIWSAIFGTSELAMRSPFILMSSFSVFLTYIIGEKWFDKATATLSAGLMAVLCFSILQGELARPYSFGLFAIMLTVYFFDKVLFSELRKWKYSIGLGIAIALAFYSHYFALLFVGFIGFIGLIFLNKINYKQYLLGCVLGVMLFLPHVSITWYHLSVGGLGWLKVPENDWLFQFVFYALNSSFLLVVPLLVLMVIGLFRFVREVEISKGLFLSFIFFIGIYLVGHALSYLVTPLLKFPVMYFALPFMLFTFSFFVVQAGLKKISIPVLLVLALTTTIYEANLLGNKHFATFKELGDKLDEWKADYPNQKITVFGNINNEDYINFYTTEDVEFVKSNFEYGDEAMLRGLLKESKTFYCAFVFASRNTPVQFFETALEAYPGIVDGYEGFNSAVYLLHRRESNIKPKTRLLRQYNSRQVIGDWEMNDAAIVKEVYLMDEWDPYGPSTLINVSEIQEGEYLIVDVTGSFREEPKITVGVNILRDNQLLEKDGEIFWMGFDLDDALEETGKGYFAFKIPAFGNYTDQLKISLWNRGEQPFYLTSIGITAKENIWNSYTP